MINYPPRCPHIFGKPMNCRKCKYGEPFEEGGGICILDEDYEDPDGDCEELDD